ncbi:MAG TPA: cupin domain-containing protein [Terriglobales bacterium]|nr:cupin domain-containing protein [Terriglobales bacterium]
MKRSLTWTGLVIAMAVLTIVGTRLLARDNPSPQAHEIVNPANLQWTPIISGWEIAVVSGNPDNVGEPFTIRFRGADGANVPPHWHPTDENITVLEGAFLVATGEKFDEHQLKPMNAGSFMNMPKEMRHFARAQGNTIVQAHGIGPFKVNWVNPSEVVPPAAAKK